MGIEINMRFKQYCDSHLDFETHFVTSLVLVLRCYLLSADHFKIITAKNRKNAEITPHNQHGEVKVGPL